MRPRHSLRLASSIIALASLAGCREAGTTSGEEDLTSRTARARSITFEGLLYLPADATDAEVRRAVDTQARTAFGPMRTSELSVATRELKAVSPDAIRKRRVTVVAADGTTTPKVEIRFTYED